MKQKKKKMFLMCMLLCLVFAFTIGNEGCNPGGGGGGTSILTIVKTDISIHNSVKIAAGDGIVAYGTGAAKGVDYVNAGDTAGQGIPGGADFASYSFVVCGKKIVMAKSDFTVTVYDTVAKTATTIPVADIRLISIPVGFESAGHIQADGNYVATINEDSEVTDQKTLKVVDVTGAVPVVTAFDTNPDGRVEQVAVDAGNKKMAAVSYDGETIYIYDITQPSNPPQTITLADGIDTQTQIRYKAGYILYLDGESYPNARLLNVADGSSILFTENPSTTSATFDMNGGKYIYFLYRDSEDYQGTAYRSALGTVPNAAPSQIASPDQITSGTDNNGYVGWESGSSITPDGTKIFIAGSGSIGQQDWLQVSTGGGFSVVGDPDDLTADGLQASDVSASNTIVGFKHGLNENTYLGYATYK